MLPREKRARYAEKYGANILKDYNDAVTHTSITLTLLAEKYGFTREYSRQLFKEINGFSFKSIKKARSQKGIAHKKALLIDPHEREKRFSKNSATRGLLQETHFYNACRSVGITVSPLYEGTDFLVNNKKVEFKSAFVSSSHSNRTDRKYYHFGLSPNEFNQLDFLVCLVVPTNDFFIIPKTAIYSTSIFIPDDNIPRKVNYPDSRFLAYKNRWELLF